MRWIIRRCEPRELTAPTFGGDTAMVDFCYCRSQRIEALLVGQRGILRLPWASFQCLTRCGFVKGVKSLPQKRVGINETSVQSDFDAVDGSWRQGSHRETMRRLAKKPQAA